MKSQGEHLSGKNQNRLLKLWGILKLSATVSDFSPKSSVANLPASESLPCKGHTQLKFDEKGHEI